MENLKVDYLSLRSYLARFSVTMKAVQPSLPWLAAVLALAGVGLLVGLGSPFGWLILGVAVIPQMFYVFYRNYLRLLPPGKGSDITSRLSGEVLGYLGRDLTLESIAEAAARTTSGQFLSVRFGLTPNFVRTLASQSVASVQDVWRLAEEVRMRNQIPTLTGSVLAVALVRSFPGYRNVLAQIHIDDDDLDKGVRWHQHLVDLIDAQTRPYRTGGVARDWSFGWIPELRRFGQNISEQMSGNRRMLSVTIPRHVEVIDQLVDTFGNGGRQNAVLVGPSGVGKTTIIHAFAERLLDADSHLPDSLRFRQVFILDSAALIAAAPGRGELESLVMQVLSEAYRAKNIIVCLDNAQLFFEEGVGAVDLSNVLQPILSAGNLRVILSMDEQRYLEISQRNPELVNAINRVNVPETNQEETEFVMQEQLIRYEVERNVTYMYQAIRESYRLSERYIHDLAMPGRALRLLESAASYSESGLVTVNSVQQAIEKTMDVKISVASTTEDRDRLLNMEQLIHQRMVNQSRAVSVVSDALRRARAGVRNENRPIGTFLFLGPTGVGKTELSKALADVYFGGEDRMVRMDMNEFVRTEDVARLIADGATDPGSLTAQVMKQPFSVVLLDEIEKAAPEVLSTLLQMLDEGILRDKNNREISFRDAIVIATSNAGADRIREYIDRGYDVAQFERQFTDELISSGQFRPEFLNRFDEMVIFRPFTKDELIQVLDLILAGVNKTLALQKVEVEVEPDAKQILVDHGYDPRLGARPMRRVVQKAVENIVAKLMLAGAVNPGDKIVIDAEAVTDALSAE